MNGIASTAQIKSGFNTLMHAICTSIILATVSKDLVARIILWSCHALSYKDMIICLIFSTYAFTLTASVHKLKNHIILHHICILKIVRKCQHNRCFALGAETTCKSTSKSFFFFRKKSQCVFILCYQHAL